MPKPRINIYISEETEKRLSKASWQSGIPKSGIVDTALRAFFSDELGDHQSRDLMKRLEDVDRTLVRLEEDCNIVSETLALFVLYYLTAATPLPSSERKAAEQLGQQRFERFVDQVIDRIRAGTNLSTNIRQGFPLSDESPYVASNGTKERAS